MANVRLEFTISRKVGQYYITETATKHITTTGDPAYVLHDIQNYLHEDGEFSNIPDGTKCLTITIECDM